MHFLVFCCLVALFLPSPVLRPHSQVLGMRRTALCQSRPVSHTQHVQRSLPSVECALRSHQGAYLFLPFYIKPNVVSCLAELLNCWLPKGPRAPRDGCVVQLDGTTEIESRSDSTITRTLSLLVCNAQLYALSLLDFPFLGQSHIPCDVHPDQPTNHEDAPYGPQQV